MACTPTGCICQESAARDPRQYIWQTGPTTATQVLGAPLRFSAGIKAPRASYYPKAHRYGNVIRMVCSSLPIVPGTFHARRSFTLAVGLSDKVIAAEGLERTT